MRLNHFLMLNYRLYRNMFDNKKNKKGRLLRNKIRFEIPEIACLRREELCDVKGLKNFATKQFAKIYHDIPSLTSICTDSFAYLIPFIND